jgi:hypothetical protein
MHTSGASREIAESCSTAFFSKSQPRLNKPPSLRGAQRRSNPDCRRGGILDCFAHARNDGELNGNAPNDGELSVDDRTDGEFYTLARNHRELTSKKEARLFGRASCSLSDGEDRRHRGLLPALRQRAVRHHHAVRRRPCEARHRPCGLEVLPEQHAAFDPLHPLPGAGRRHLARATGTRARRRALALRQLGPYRDEGQAGSSVRQRSAVLLAVAQRAAGRRNARVLRVRQTAGAHPRNDRLVHVRQRTGESRRNDLLARVRRTHEKSDRLARVQQLIDDRSRRALSRWRCVPPKQRLPARLAPLALRSLRSDPGGAEWQGERAIASSRSSKRGGDTRAGLHNSWTSTNSARTARSARRSPRRSQADRRICCDKNIRDCAPRPSRDPLPSLRRTTRRHSGIREC